MADNVSELVLNAGPVAPETPVHVPDGSQDHQDVSITATAQTPAASRPTIKIVSITPTTTANPRTDTASNPGPQTATSVPVNTAPQIGSSTIVIRAAQADSATPVTTAPYTDSATPVNVDSATPVTPAPPRPADSHTCASCASSFASLDAYIQHKLSSDDCGRDFSHISQSLLKRLSGSAPRGRGRGRGRGARGRPRGRPPLAGRKRQLHGDAEYNPDLVIKKEEVSQESVKHDRLRLHHTPADIISATAGYDCPKCGRHFRREAALRRHTEHDHRKRDSDNSDSDLHDDDDNDSDTYKPENDPASAEPEEPSDDEQGTGDENVIVIKPRQTNTVIVDLDGNPLPDDYLTRPQAGTEGNHGNEDQPDVVQVSRTVLGHPTEESVIGPPKILPYVKRERDNVPTCSLCQRQFKNSLILRTHMLTHSAARNYRCTMAGCPYAFKTKGSLTRHIRRHTGERPYKCKNCGRAFRESGCLTRHLKSRGDCSERPDNEFPRYKKNLSFTPTIKLTTKEPPKEFQHIAIEHPNGKIQIESVLSSDPTKPIYQVLEQDMSADGTKELVYIPISPSRAATLTQLDDFYIQIKDGQGAEGAEGGPGEGAEGQMTSGEVVELSSQIQDGQILQVTEDGEIIQMPSHGQGIIRVQDEHGRVIEIQQPMTTHEGQLTTHDGTLTMQEATQEVQLTTHDGTLTMQEATQEVQLTTQEGTLTMQEGQLTIQEESMASQEEQLIIQDGQLTTQDGQLVEVCQMPSQDGEIVEVADQITRMGGQILQIAEHSAQQEGQITEIQSAETAQDEADTEAPENRVVPQNLVRVVQTRGRKRKHQSDTSQQLESPVDQILEVIPAVDIQEMTSADTQDMTPTDLQEVTSVETHEVTPAGTQEVTSGDTQEVTFFSTQVVTSSQEGGEEVAMETDVQQSADYGPEVSMETIDQPSADSGQEVVMETIIQSGDETVAWTMVSEEDLEGHQGLSLEVQNTSVTDSGSLEVQDAEPDEALILHTDPATETGQSDPGEGAHCCQACLSQSDTVTFTSCDALIDHLKTHLANVHHRCDKCNYIADSADKLQEHLQITHHRAWSKDTDSMGGDQTRVQVVNVGNQGSVKDGQPADVDTMATSQEVSEERVRLAVTALDQITGLRSDDRPESRSRCPVCERTFRGPTYLKNHLRTHTGERVFGCPQCDKAFYTKDALNKHSVAHSKARQYKCGECGKLFKRISHVREHLKVHSSERPFPCKVCFKMFKTVNACKVHMRTHDTVMPLTCPRCNKPFREKGALDRHLRTHTGERPYACPHCGRNFAEHGTLNRHLKAKVPCTKELHNIRMSQTPDKPPLGNTEWIATQQGAAVVQLSTADTHQGEALEELPVTHIKPETQHDVNMQLSIIPAADQLSSDLDPAIKSEEATVLTEFSSVVADTQYIRSDQALGPTLLPAGTDTDQALGAASLETDQTLGMLSQGAELVTQGSAEAQDVEYIIMDHAGVNDNVIFIDENTGQQLQLVPSGGGDGKLTIMPQEAELVSEALPLVDVGHVISEDSEVVTMEIQEGQLMEEVIA